MKQAWIVEVKKENGTLQALIKWTGAKFEQDTDQQSWYQNSTDTVNLIGESPDKEPASLFDKMDLISGSRGNDEKSVTCAVIVSYLSECS